MSPRHRGRCLCGGVRYEVDGELGDIVMCHCAMCRRASGTAFATNAPVPSGAFRIVAGEDLLGTFESSPGGLRRFCRNCGSPVYKTDARWPGQVRIRLGLLETPVGRRPAGHVHVDSKADWDEICDDLPVHDTP